MEKTIIILHGWGLSGARYHELQKLLEEKNYSVYSPDMPGFGEEPLVKEAMNIDDYVAFVVKFMKKNKIQKASFIGHSFGGRVTAKFAVMHPELVEKIVFTGSPLIREKLSFKNNVLQYFAGKGKMLLRNSPELTQKFARKVIYRLLGEYDYYKANKLQETFKNVIYEDGASYIGKIKLPTLLMWGEKDTITHVRTGEKISEIIPNAKLEIIKNAGHGIPYTHAKEFSRHVLSFLK